MIGEIGCQYLYCCSEECCKVQCVCGLSQQYYWQVFWEQCGYGLVQVGIDQCDQQYLVGVVVVEEVVDGEEYVYFEDYVDGLQQVEGGGVVIVMVYVD